MIVDGSFVMRSVDGDMGPSDIDLVVILPSSWVVGEELGAAEYNLLSKNRVRKRYHFHIFPAAAGSDAERKWTEYFMQVNTKWFDPLKLPAGLSKGIVKVLR